MTPALVVRTAVEKRLPQQASKVVVNKVMAMELRHHHQLQGLPRVRSTLTQPQQRNRVAVGNEQIMTTVGFWLRLIVGKTTLARIHM